MCMRVHMLMLTTKVAFYFISREIWSHHQSARLSATVFIEAHREIFGWDESKGGDDVAMMYVLRTEAPLFDVPLAVLRPFSALPIFIARQKHSAAALCTARYCYVRLSVVPCTRFPLVGVPATPTPVITRGTEFWHAWRPRTLTVPL